MRRALSGAALLAVSVAAAAVAAVLAEGALRLFLPQPLYAFERGLFVPDAAVGYRLAPSREAWHNQPDFSYRIRTNRLGFRGPEPRMDAAVRVVVFFYWNDLDAAPLRVTDGYLRLASDDPAGRTREYLNNHSHLYALIKMAYHRFYRRPTETTGWTIPDADLDVGVEELRRMRDAAAAAAAGFLVVIVPLGGAGHDGSEWHGTRARWVAALVNGAIAASLERTAAAR